MNNYRIHLNMDKLYAELDKAEREFVRLSAAVDGKGFFATLFWSYRNPKDWQDIVHATDHLKSIQRLVSVCERAARAAEEKRKT